MSGRNQPKTLVLGLGNDLLSDDAIGLRIARELKRRFKEDPEILVLESLEMGLALLDVVSGFETLIIVDAIQTNSAPPGYLHSLQVNQMSCSPLISPHFLGLGELLALGRELGLTMPGEVRIFAIEVQDTCTLNSQMTPALLAAFPGLVERLVEKCCHVVG